jgi:hypothetical protein
MIALLCFFLALFVSPFKSKSVAGEDTRTQRGGQPPLFGKGSCCA